MIPVMKKKIVEHMENFRDFAKAGKPMELFDQTVKISGDIVCALFFGSDFRNVQLGGESITVAVARLVDEAAKYNMTVGNLLLGDWTLKYGLNKEARKLKKDTKEFKEVIINTIEKRKQTLGQTEQGEKARKDLLEVLLAIPEGSKDHLEDKEITDLFITLFLAGMDTIAHTLTMVLYFLSKDASALETIRKEISQVIPDENDITAEKLNRLEFTTACIKEALRIFPPFGFLFMREAKEDHTLGNIQIKKGMEVNVQIFTLGRRSEIRDCEEFIPDRWLNGEMTKTHPFNWIPFSAGMKNCIGQHVAMFEMKIFLIAFLNRFNFGLEKPSTIDLKWEFMLKPKVPITMRLKEKQN